MIPRPRSLEPALQLLTVDDVADALRVSKRTVWRLVRRGCLRRVRTGRAVRIRHADLEKFISVGGGE